MKNFLIEFIFDVTGFTYAGSRVHPNVRAFGLWVIEHNGPSVADPMNLTKRSAILQLGSTGLSFHEYK